MNSAWTTPWLDQFFPFWTDFTRSPAFYVILPFILVLIFLRRGWPGISVLLGGVAVASLADSFFGGWVKHFFTRLRPEFSNIPFEVLIRGPSQSGFSFPSSHAVDAFCLAGFVLFYYPKARLPLLIFAGLTAYSRVYCGYHFPSDILTGGILGYLFGWLGAYLISLTISPLKKKFGKNKA
ncbi:putative undecaprenyl-diphosphatase YbjG [compost metagenome]